MKATKQQLTSLLSKHIMSVQFVKRDGTNRNIICTLKEGIVVPYEKKTESAKKTKAATDGLMAVWDIEKDAFRSFRLDSIIDYQVVSEGYEL